MKQNLHNWSIRGLVTAMFCLAFGINASMKRSVNEAVSSCSTGKDSSFTVKEWVDFNSQAIQNQAIVSLNLPHQLW